MATNPFGPMYPPKDPTTTTTSRPKSQPSNPSQAAKPTRLLFDPWNSSSTGHQRAENRLGSSISWRDSRTAKLRSQYGDAAGGGGKRISDTVGAGSKGFGADGRLANGGFEVGASGLRGEGQRSLWEWEGVRTKKPGGVEVTKGSDAGGGGKGTNAQELDYATSKTVAPSAPYDLNGLGVKAQLSPPAQDASTSSTDQDHPKPDSSPKPKPIFRNLTIYINGSTYPLISDHKLKHLLVTHGANISISLGRRTVTHVILGHANGMLIPGTTNRGAGGGLAASKIQKEIMNGKGGKGVKFVSAEWVVECVRAGRRVPESGFAVGVGGERKGLRMKGQGSVLGAFGKESKPGTADR